jgi:predicted alpha/beta-hydrolase family hydrolase
VPSTKKAKKTPQQQQDKEQPHWFQALAQVCAADDDEDILFGKFVGKKIQQIKNAQLKAKCQSEITTIIFDFIQRYEDRFSDC